MAGAPELLGGDRLYQNGIDPRAVATEGIGQQLIANDRDLLRSLMEQGQNPLETAFTGLLRPRYKGNAQLLRHFCNPWAFVIGKQAGLQAIAL